MVAKVNAKDRVAKNLRAFRLKAGYSQEKLSELSGVPPRMIQYLEQLPGKNTSLETLQKLADGLDLTINDLIGGPANGKKANKQEKEALELAVRILNAYISEIK